MKKSEQIFLDFLYFLSDFFYNLLPWGQGFLLPRPPKTIDFPRVSHCRFLYEIRRKSIFWCWATKPDFRFLINIWKNILLKKKCLFFKTKLFIYWSYSYRKIGYYHHFINNSTKMLISSFKKIAYICFKLQTVWQEFVVVTDDGWGTLAWVLSEQELSCCEPKIIIIFCLF